MSSNVEEPLRGLFFFQGPEKICFSYSETMAKIIFPFAMFHFGTLLAAHSIVKILCISDDYESDQYKYGFGHDPIPPYK